MTTKEMMRATQRPGHWWVNIAPVDCDPEWQEQIAPHTADTSLLFGYDRDEFMRKQYRT